MKAWTALAGIFILAVIALGIWKIVTPGDGAAPNLASGYAGLIAPEKLLRVPVTGIYPGGSPQGLNADLQNPLANDPDAIARGAKDFDAFNCSGCHAPHGGGGMGPSLSDDIWIHGNAPGNIYLSIAQGRSSGMPAFGAMLPDRTIWELVAYIQSIAQKPGAAFGSTTSLDPQLPDSEQIPAGKIDTTRPWDHTEKMPPAGLASGTTADAYAPAAP